MRMTGMLTFMNVPMDSSLKIKKNTTEAQNSDYSDKRKIRSGKDWSESEGRDKCSFTVLSGRKGQESLARMT